MWQFQCLVLGYGLEWHVPTKAHIYKPGSVTRLWPYQWTLSSLIEPCWGMTETLWRGDLLESPEGLFSAVTRWVALLCSPPLNDIVPHVRRSDAVSPQLLRWNLWGGANAALLLFGSLCQILHHSSENYHIVYFLYSTKEQCTDRCVTHWETLGRGSRSTASEARLFLWQLK